MEQYYGLNKIIAVVAIDEKTPTGGEMVEMAFENNTKEKTTKLRFEFLVSNEPCDPSTIQQKINARLGALLFSTLHEYGIKVGEVNGISDAVVQLVNAGQSKAEQLMWGFDYDNIPLLEINSVLLKHAKSTENTDGGTSTGSGTN